MSETTTENPKPEAAAPVTATTAPETKPAEGASTATTPTETVAKTPGTEPAKKSPADFFKQREDKREKRAQERVIELERELAAYKAKPAQDKVTAPEPEKEPLFSLDDPEGSFENMRQRATQDAVEAIKREHQEQERQTEYLQATDKAKELLLTRSHLKEDPKAADEIAAILESKYGRMALYSDEKGNPAGRDPMNAARLAYLDWCQSKGVVPDLDGIPKPTMQLTAGRASAGVSPTAPGAGQRVWAKGEVKKYLNEVPAGSDEWRRRVDETEEAYREGRVQR